MHLITKSVRKNSLLYLLGMLLLPLGLKAQCEIKNNNFQEGEVLLYDMYFKYGILYTKAGSSSLSINNSMYNGKNVYQATLIGRSSGFAKSIISVSDTINAYMTKDIVPLAYTKDAHEGKDHTIERATYTYHPDGKVSVRNINNRNGKLRYDTLHVANSCMYDVLSILYYARTLDYDNMVKGDKATVSFFAGRRKVTMDIEHHGIENMKANDGREYNCIKLVMMMNADAFADKDEAMKVFITNDLNRIPVRIDSKLKIGSTRVILKEYKGQRN